MQSLPLFHEVSDWALLHWPVKQIVHDDQVLIRYSNVNLILRVVGVTMRFESPRQSRFCNFARCIVLNSDVATKTDRIFYDR